jgi:branched-chain amino acid transport system ATP-binding protein
MASMDRPILTGAGLGKQFGGTVALAEVDFVLMEGEALGLIGPNGAGKTTLINVISGHVRPSSGEVRFRDRRIDRLEPHRIARLGITRTFQVVRPFLGMSVEENILVGALFGCARHQTDRDARAVRIDEILALVGLSQRRRDPVLALNIADRKRVELGRALAMEPSVLLLDELVAGLNPTEMAELIEVARTINRAGVTLVVVEHVMPVVVGLCRRVMVLHHGRKIADGPPDRVLGDGQVVEAYLGKSYADRFGFHDARLEDPADRDGA